MAIKILVILALFKLALSIPDPYPEPNINIDVAQEVNFRGLRSRACSPTKSCKYAGGYCVSHGDECDGKVDSKGCKGGPTGYCKCCIPACEKNPDSECVDRQHFWGDCPADMHYSLGSCRNHKICCKKNAECGVGLGSPNGMCYRTDPTTQSCPLPLFPWLVVEIHCPEQGMSCCNNVYDPYCSCDRWGYRGLCAERGWSQFCPNFCDGSLQSPINLYQQNLADIIGYEFNYKNYDELPDNLTCNNNGHYAKCLWNSADVPTISGGNLIGTYIFDSMHWHIGCGDGTGSDHTKDGQSFSAELHLVHYKQAYGSVSMALNSGEKDALAVLGIFLNVNESTGNPAYDDITENLMFINSGNSSADPEITFTYGHTLFELLPALNSRGDRPFYRYYGSLTHPSCDEVVEWTVFQDPSYMSKYQIWPFRCMTTGRFPGSPEPNGLLLCDNHRQIQPLNGRKVTLWTVLAEESLPSKK